MERKRRPDLDERFSLDPLTAEEVLHRLLSGSDDADSPEEEEVEEP